VKGYTERKVTKTTGKQEKRRDWQRQKQKFWNRERRKQRKEMKIEGRKENTCEVKVRTVMLMTEVVPGYYAISTCK